MSLSACSGSHFGWSGAFWVALSAFVLGGIGLSAGGAGLSGGGGGGSCAKLGVGAVSSTNPINTRPSAACRLLPITSVGCSLLLRMLQTFFVHQPTQVLHGSRATPQLALFTILV